MLERLTKREKEVLELISQGLTNEEIAEKLIISRKTVHTHIDQIYTKLDLSLTTPKKSVLRLRAALVYWERSLLKEINNAKDNRTGAINYDY